jgi:oligosaccharide repeat unit polymerase
VILALALANLLIMWGIAHRLKLRESGLFSLGALSLLTATLPHYGLYPLYMILKGDPDIHSRYFAQAVFLVTLSSTCLLVGMLSTKHTDIPMVRRLSSIPTPKSLSIVLLIAAFVALLGLMYYFRKTINPLELMETSRAADARDDYMEFNLSYPLTFLRAAVFFLQTLAIVEIYRLSKKRRALFECLAVTFVCAFIMLSFGSRSLLFLPFIIFLYLTHHLYRKIPLVVLGGVVLVSIPIFALLRLVSGGGMTMESAMAGGMHTDTTFILDEFIRRFNNFTNVVDFLEWFDKRSRGFDFSIGQIFIRPIPRTIIPDKPASLDVYLSQAIYGERAHGGGIHIFGGLVEMYYNFWIPGIIVWFFLLGRMSYRLHFGTKKMLESGEMLAAVIIISNFALVRGLFNMGINTIGTQNLLMTIAAQLALLFVYQVAAYPLMRKLRSTASYYYYPRSRGRPAEAYTKAESG